jgi:DNA-binding PadR family transcriptional regulator
MKSNEYIKGTIKTIVLKLLNENRRMYGYEISQKVADLSSNEIQLTYGALYPILYKLQHEGILTTESEIVDNRARKYYSLTKQGQSLAVTKITELQNFAKTLLRVMQPDVGAQLKYI